MCLALSERAVQAMLDKLGLGECAGAFPGRPELVVMDEPFVSLHATTADEIPGLTETLIAEMRPATVFVTHAPSEAARLADRVLHLDGAPATLSAAPACDRPASGAGSHPDGGRDGRT